MPSFYWNLICGTDGSTELYFHTVHGGRHIWRFIPLKIQDYYGYIFHEGGVDLSGVEQNNIHHEQYEGCDLTNHKPICVDMTVEINSFCKDVESLVTKKFMQALEPTCLAGSDSILATLAVISCCLRISFTVRLRLPHFNRVLLPHGALPLPF